MDTFTVQGDPHHHHHRTPDGGKPHDVLLKLHPNATWNNPVFWVSMVTTAFLLLCSLFWFIETVGANFVHQWALMLAMFIGGAIGVITLTFLIPWYLSLSARPEHERQRSGYSYSAWHRWAMWSHYVAIVVQVAVATVAVWAWLERHDIGISDGRFDVGAAPASPESIRYTQATLAATLPSGILFFVALYAWVRHVYVEAGDVKSYSHK